jgi:hypothetical protein
MAANTISILSFFVIVIFIFIRNCTTSNNAGNKMVSYADMTTNHRREIPGSLSGDLPWLITPAKET